jgi:hypothetical protein
MAPVSDAEILQWQDKYEPFITQDRDSRTARIRARNAIRTQRHKDFVLTAPPQSSSKKTKTSKEQPPQSLTLLAKTASQINTMPTRSAIDQLKYHLFLLLLLLLS